MSQHINRGAWGNRVNILTASAGPAVTQKAAWALKQAYNQHKYPELHQISFFSSPVALINDAPRCKLTQNTSASDTAPCLSEMMHLSRISPKNLLGNEDFIYIYTYTLYCVLSLL